jgi:hypothetical protein
MFENWKEIETWLLLAVGPHDSPKNLKGVFLFYQKVRV